MKKLLNKQLQNDCLRYLHQKINEKAGISVLILKRDKKAHLAKNLLYPLKKWYKIKKEKPYYFCELNSVRKVW